MKKFFLLLISLMWTILPIAGCGKKAPPIPRDQVLAKEAEKEKKDKPNEVEKTTEETVVETNIDTTDTKQVKDNQ